MSLSSNTVPVSAPVADKRRWYMSASKLYSGLLTSRKDWQKIRIVARIAVIPKRKIGTSAGYDVAQALSLLVVADEAEASEVVSVALAVVVAVPGAEDAREVAVPSAVSKHQVPDY